jgi:hypothetical protein
MSNFLISAIIKNLKNLFSDLKKKKIKINMTIFELKFI